jgi:hypothetical protein
VQEIDPTTATQSALISGLKTAIGVLPLSDGDDLDYLVLQHASAGPFFGGPGLVQHFETPANPPTLVTNCLVRPTSMTPNQKTGKLYVTEHGGRVVAVNLN